MPEEKIHEAIVIYDLVTQLCYSGFLNDRITFKEAEQKIKMCLDQQTKKLEKELTEYCLKVAELTVENKRLEKEIGSLKGLIKAHEEVLKQLWQQFKTNFKL